MTWLAVPILAVFVLYFFTVVRRVGLLSPDALFAYTQILMAVGSMPLLDANRPADVMYGQILAYTIITYMLVGFVLHTRKRSTIPVRVETITFRPGQGTAVFIAISIAIVVLYYYSIGYVTFFEGLRNLAGGQNDIATLRLDSYSGSRYLFPGYVNQFKNSLLPALVVVTLTYWLRRKRVPLLPAFVLTLVALGGLLGTGQRGAFIVFVFATIVYLYLLDARSFPRRTVSLMIVAVPIVLLSTLALGRSAATVEQQESSISKAAVAASEFGNRIIFDNQNSAVIGFRYIYELEVQNGSEWVQSITGILPGSSGSNLANRIYATIYGTDRGTSPESIWGSIYHNFGWFGIGLAPILLAVIASSMTKRIARTPRRSTLTVMGMAGTTTVFAMWITSPPTFLLNGGIVVYAAMWFVGKRLDARTESHPRQANLASARATREPRLGHLVPISELPRTGGV